MPQFDGTGPKGQGPMTGQGKGRCIIQLNTTEQELGFLKNQEQTFKKQLKQIKSRIKHIEDKNNLKEEVR